MRRIIQRTKAYDQRFAVGLAKLFYSNLKVNRFVVYEMDLTQEIKSFTDIRSDYDLRVLKYDDLGAYLPELEELPSEFHMHEIDGVENCVVALKNGRIAHISWLYLKGDQDRWFDLAEDQADLNYSLTLPEHRGKALFPQALIEAVRWFRENNINTILMEVHESTKNMIRSMKKVPEVNQIGILTHWFLYRPKFEYRRE